MTNRKKNTLNVELGNSSNNIESIKVYKNLVNDIKKIILENPNHYSLGEKVRRLGIDYLDIHKND